MIRFLLSGFCFAALVVWLFVCLVLLRMPWAKVIDGGNIALFIALLLGALDFALHVVAAVCMGVAWVVRRVPGWVRGCAVAVRSICAWAVTPSAVPVLRAAAVAALVLIALCLVVIACVLVF